MVRYFAGKIPLLGVCLGHQCIGHVYGGRVVRHTPKHGKTSIIHHDGKTIFSAIPSPIEGGRYHSLIVESGNLPSFLEVSARTESGVVMGLRHKDLVVEGVQFHPESILTATGHSLLQNFLCYSSPLRE